MSLWINLNLVFLRFQKNKLYEYCNVKILELIERISKLNLILQDHARRIQDHETDVRRIHDQFTSAIVHFYGILVCFGVYRVFNLFSEVA